MRCYPLLRRSMRHMWWVVPAAVYARLYAKILRADHSDDTMQRQFACAIHGHRPIKYGFCQTCGAEVSAMWYDW